MLFVGCCVLIAVVLYLVIRGASLGKDWEREDREQLEYLREYARKHGKNPP